MSDMYIPQMPITNVVNELTNIYTALINGNLSYASIPTPFLWGPPGVGKSDGVRQLALRLEENTGKHVIVTDIRLLLFSPIDLRGVPVADETKSFTDWLKPRILDLNEDEGVVNILFLDELSAAPQSVQAAAYQLTLNRAIGEHELPVNTIVIAAGNRTTDRAVAYKMPSALANRMMHFDICVDFKTWKQWAVEKGNVHPLVLGFLSYDMSKLYQEDKGIDEVAFPTPRSWMFVSNILNALDDVEDLRKYQALIAGCIGMGTTVEFIGWSKIQKELPKVSDVFDGKLVAIPGSPDVLHALIASMTTYATQKEQGIGLDKEEVENVCNFCASIPMDYAATFFWNVFAVESIKRKFTESERFIVWRNRYRKVYTAVNGEGE